jgi:hypothetical protein
MGAAFTEGTLGVCLGCGVGKNVGDVCCHLSCCKQGGWRRESRTLARSCFFDPEEQLSLTQLTTLLVGSGAKMNRLGVNN